MWEQKKRTGVKPRVLQECDDSDSDILGFDVSAFLKKKVSHSVMCIKSYNTYVSMCQCVNRSRVATILQLLLPTRIKS